VQDCGANVDGTRSFQMQEGHTRPLSTTFHIVSTATVVAFHMFMFSLLAFVTLQFSAARHICQVLTFIE
jgi:hypothetical protein